MQKVDDIPVAKPLYAERLNDKKEFFVCAGYINRESGLGGLKGIAKDGEKADLADGTFRLYRR